MPLMKNDCRRAGSPTDVDVREAPEQLAEHHADLAAREVGAETEVRARAAEADVLVGLRARRRTSNGRSKTASSRFAELYHSTTFSPSRISCPRNSVSRVAVRRKWITGVAQRTISSTAVGATRSKSASHSARCSGCSLNAFMPWLIALRVVSLPATTSRTKNEPSSCVGEPLAVDLGVDQRGGQVVGRVLSGACRASSCDELPPAPRPPAGWPGRSLSGSRDVLGIAGAEDDVGAIEDEAVLALRECPSCRR